MGLLSRHVKKVPSSASARNFSEPQWPAPGEYMVTRRVCDYNYDVSWPTGGVVSTNPTASWTRGNVIRQQQPNMHPPTLGYFAYDPTDPTTWVGNRVQ